jgi:glycosyltransferase involved in cell wall biosynthesis
MRPLRVAYLPPSLRPGGAEKQMLALAQGLPRDRFRVDFVSVSGPGEYDALASAVGARLRSLGKPPSADSRSVDRIARRARKLLRYASLARAARYDIIDAWLYPADIMAALMRPLTGTPIVIAGRRSLWDFEGEFGRLELGLAAVAYRWVDAIVANSAAVAADTIERVHVDPAKVRIIRNGVEAIEQVSADERLALRARFGTGTGLQIGCIANYRPVKRLDLLIEAFAPLAAEDPTVTLVLVGEGPLREDLQAQIGRLGLDSRVRLHGAELDPRSLYEAFDIVVQGSQSEGLPNAMLEAAAAGRPIVATAVGGTGEIILDGQTGLLVPASDPTALTSALRRLAADPALRDSLGAAAREHVARTFGMDRFVTEFATLYESLAAQKRVIR